MKTLTRSFSHEHRRGFTLMEVLVSSALTVVILSMLFTVLIGAMNAWQVGTSRLSENADARLALDSIAQDLQSLVVRNSSYNQEWLYANTVPVPDAPGRQSTWLTFFAPSLDRQPGQQGDIVAVSYRVGYQDALSNANNPEHRIFGLYKHMIDTRNTFQHALGLPNVRAAFWENSGMDGNLAPSVANPAAPGTRWALDQRSLLIPHVVDFSIKWHVRAGNSLGLLGNEYQAVRINNSFLYGESNPETEFPGARLEAADISLTILSEEGARRVQTLARAGDAQLASQLPGVIREFGRVYTKRVKIEY